MGTQILHLFIPRAFQPLLRLLSLDTCPLFANTRTIVINITYRLATHQAHDSFSLQPSQGTIQPVAAESISHGYVAFELFYSDFLIGDNGVDHVTDAHYTFKQFRVYNWYMAHVVARHDDHALIN
jgi:hypothetical protein